MKGTVSGAATARLTVALSAAAVVVASLALAGPSDAAIPREFSARARAFPVEPDPGQNQTSFAVRPVAAAIGLASSPMGVNGRAAIIDLGIAEAQVGSENFQDLGREFPPEESFVRCDSVSPNVPDEGERVTGTVRMSARCDDSPAGEVATEGMALASVVPAATLDALGITGGVVHSTVRGDASGSEVIVEVEASVVDLTVGALHVDEVRYRAVAASAGVPGSARAEADVDVVAATVNGVPVIVGPDGVGVGETSVAAPFLAGAARSVSEAFSGSEFMDLRVVSPETAAAEDGSRASVDGGGLHLFLTRSGDPADREFLGLTILGGEIEVEVGGERVTGGRFDLAPFTAGATGAGLPLSARPAVTLAPSASPAVAAPPSAASGESPPPRVDLASATARRTLEEPSSWWLLPLVLGALLGALAAASSQGPMLPVRRRLGTWWNVVAESFLRG